MDSQHEYTHQNYWKMKFEEGEYYTNKDRYTIPGTFVFENGQMKCTNMIGSKGEPYIIRNPNPNEWERFVCPPLLKPSTLTEELESKKSTEALILSFRNMLANYKEDFWSPGELLDEYDKHFHITSQRNGKL